MAYLTPLGLQIVWNFLRDSHAWWGAIDDAPWGSFVGSLAYLTSPTGQADLHTVCDSSCPGMEATVSRNWHWMQSHAADLSEAFSSK